MRFCLSKSQIFLKYRLIINYLEIHYSISTEINGNPKYSFRNGIWKLQKGASRRSPHVTTFQRGRLREMEGENEPYYCCAATLTRYLSAELFCALLLPRPLVSFSLSITLCLDAVSDYISRIESAARTCNPSWPVREFRDSDCNGNHHNEANVTLNYWDATEWRQVLSISFINQACRWR